jgi:GDPmannose 4,6-dehydratase
MQWLMLQQEKPRDFVIATGKQFSVRHFVELASSCLNKSLIWKGSGIDEVGYWDDQAIIRIDQRYFRPTEVDTLLGDSSFARQQLGWEPKITFEDLVSEMMESDLSLAKKDALLHEHGFSNSRT